MCEAVGGTGAEEVNEDDADEAGDGDEEDSHQSHGLAHVVLVTRQILLAQLVEDTDMSPETAAGTTPWFVARPGPSRVFVVRVRLFPPGVHNGN